MSNPKSQKYFVDGWLDDIQFKDWMVKDKENTIAGCSVCHKVIELLSSGKLALTDNALSNVQNFLSQEVLCLVVKQLLRLLHYRQKSSQPLSFIWKSQVLLKLK